MKYFLFFAVVLTSYSQTVHHQSLSSQGNSIELHNGVFISQTVGQQSVTGNSTKNGYTIGQGYQQSLWGKYISSYLPSEITTITYPNPFISTVNFQFSKPINETISIAVFDVQGRLVYNQEKLAAENTLTLDLANLASSNYLIRLASTNYIYYTQILKK